MKLDEAMKIIENFKKNPNGAFWGSKQKIATECLIELAKRIVQWDPNEKNLIVSSVINYLKYDLDSKL